MATKTWIGNAHAVKQITTLTVSGTWTANDTYTVTVNGKDLVLTIGNGTTTAQVAASIRDMWNASSRIDGTGDNTNTSNAGGQEFGEFAEATAVIYSTATSVVRITANKAGLPITISQTVNTAGDGDVAQATAQAATGPNYWDNGDNWSGGSAPANDDTVNLKDSDVSILYGWPAATLEVTLNYYKSFTGQLGLPVINRSNAAKPYNEYRTRFPTFGAGGAGTTITHRLGIGPGVGSPLFIFVHTGDANLKVSALVYGTGSPQALLGDKALYMEIDNGSADGTITILDGSVSLGDKVAGDTNVATVNVSAGDVRLSPGGYAQTVNQSGGTVTYPDRASHAANLTLNIFGGTFISNLLGASTVTVTVTNALLIWNSAETIDALTLGTNGTLDLEKDWRAVTISTCDLFEGSKLLDENARGTYSAGIDLNRCGIDDVTIRVGNNRRLTLGTAA